jgi:type VI secretion system protein ImpJ
VQHLPVNWYEGLFLLPQHFQAADRYWTEVAHISEQFDHPYYYGLQSIDFSREALANSQFEVRSLRARMRDGTIISIDPGQEPDRVDCRHEFNRLREPVTDLNAAFDKETVITVYLAVPKLKLGRANVSTGHSSTDTRYSETSLNLQDEVCGGNDLEVQFRSLNVRILLSTQDLSGYEVLPIAQIKRAGEGEAVPRLDTEYIPPLLSISAWPGLGRDIVRAVYDVIGQKIDTLSRQLVNRGIGLDSRHPGDLDRIFMLSALNAAHARLSVLAFANGVHPLVAYTELCGIVGQLGIFSSERRAKAVPQYNHDDLARIFAVVRTEIEQNINAVREYEFQQRYFVGVGMGMQVSLEPRWFNSDWQWFIGVNKGDLTHQECRDLLSAGQLDWKLGSARQVEVLFNRRAEGLILSPVERPIRALPSSQDWMFYEVPRKDNPAFRDVEETQTLAMRLKDSLIENLGQLQGERHLIVTVRGRRMPLEFALFAVPIQS